MNPDVLKLSFLITVTPSTKCYLILMFDHAIAANRSTFGFEIQGY